MKNRSTSTNTIITYSIIILVLVALKILTADQFHLFDFMGTVGQYILNAILQIGILFCGAVFLFKVFQKAKLKEIFKFYGFKKISWKGIGYSILLGIIVYILNVFVASFFSLLLRELGYSYGQSSMTSYPVWLFFINIVTACILPAICEETLHRGMLLKGLSGYGMKKAIIISSLLFGLMHMNIEQFFYTTLIGLFLGLLTSRCDCIIPAMIVHFMNNFLSTFMQFSSMNNLGVEGVFTFINTSFANNPMVALLFVITLIVLLLILAKTLVRKITEESMLKQMHSLQDALIKELMRGEFFAGLEEFVKLGEGEEDKFKKEDIHQLVHKRSLEYGITDEITDSIILEGDTAKPGKLEKVLLVCSFVLMGIVTLISFIIGVL